MRRTRPTVLSAISRERRSVPHRCHLCTTTAPMRSFHSATEVRTVSGPSYTPTWHDGPPGLEYSLARSPQHAAAQCSAAQRSSGSCAMIDSAYCVHLTGGLGLVLSCAAELDAHVVHDPLCALGQPAGAIEWSVAVRKGGHPYRSDAQLFVVAAVHTLACNTADHVETKCNIMIAAPIIRCSELSSQSFRMNRYVGSQPVGSTH
jgi:hypothetical protein